LLGERLDEWLFDLPREVPRWELLRLDEDFFFGTFPPSLRASERPMAMACLRLVTFLPLRPLLSVPFFFSCIARFTLLLAFAPYFRPPEDLRDEELFVAMQNSPFT